MYALLPEGRVIAEPDSAKLVKVVSGPGGYVIIVKLDDDTEVLIKTCDQESEAFAFADACANAINGDDEDASEDSSGEEPASVSSSSQTSGKGSSSGRSDSSSGRSDSSSGRSDSSSGRSDSSSGRSDSSSGRSGDSKSVSGKGASRNSVNLGSGPAPSEDSDSDRGSAGSKSEVKLGSATAQEPSEEIEDPIEFPNHGSALEDSLDDSDEWPCDDGKDDWFD